MQRCPNGHVERVWYNSCRHRACPQCNGLAKEQWLERTRARLIDCAHWHVVFTIPHQLNVLWMLNTDAMMGALFAAARDTLLELLSDPRHLGAQPGMMLALHTWGRSLNLHPHLHALVSDGGLHDGRWVQPRRSHFLPATVVMQLFRGKLLDALRQLHQRGELRLPDGLSAERLVSLLNRLGRKVKWNVRVCARYEHGRGVSVYLARYVKGGPFRNTQIVRAGESQIVFRYTPHSEQGQPKRSATLTLVPRALPRARARARPRAQSTQRALLRAVRARLRRTTQCRSRPTPAAARAADPAHRVAELLGALPTCTGQRTLSALSRPAGARGADCCQPRSTVIDNTTRTPQTMVRSFLPPPGCTRARYLPNHPRQRCACPVQPGSHFLTTVFATTAAMTSN